MVPPDSSGISRVPLYSGTQITVGCEISRTGLSPCAVGRSRPLPLSPVRPAGQAPPGPYNPEPTRSSVWASPRSLAATWGISFDFSSWGYLDVSVLPVGSAEAVTDHYVRRVAPFGNSGITGCVRLPQTYRGLPRPSSPVRAKASTVRPYFAWPNIHSAPESTSLNTHVRGQWVRNPSARHSHFLIPTTRIFKEFGRGMAFACICSGPASEGPS